MALPPLLLIISVIFATSISADTRLPVVRYLDNGQIKSITGEKAVDGYRFNTQANKTINLATLQWPPYIGDNLCNKGWVFQFAVALLVKKGYQVNIHFYPWARAVRLVELGVMDILFPEYFIESGAPSDNVQGQSRRHLLALSKRYPGGEISF